MAASSEIAQSQSPVRRASSTALKRMLFSLARLPARRARAIPSRSVASAPRGSSRAVIEGSITRARNRASLSAASSAILRAPSTSARACHWRPL